MQQKTQRPVQFEITEQTRSALAAWIHQAQLRSEDSFFPSRLHTSNHLSTRQYARIVKGWVKAVGLDPAMYGIHTMRRTKASLIYRRTMKIPTWFIPLSETLSNALARGVAPDIARLSRYEVAAILYVLQQSKPIKSPVRHHQTR